MTVLDVDTSLAPVLERLSAALETAHVPGMEVAVVRGGETLYAGGLGVRGVEDPTPVGPGTLFDHGSCGKAFTGLLCAVLADAGVLDLDAPLRTYIPELRLPDPVIAERATVRDVLSHRSGLGRHDLAWILNPSWSRAEIVARLAHLPLEGDLRAQCSYSNFGFALAGVAIERATGRTFEDELAARVFEPLGMSRTFSLLDRALADDDHARAHLVRDGAAVETPWRSIDAVKPAGSVITCAEDSIRWLRLHLGDGAISADVVRRTHAMQVPVDVQFPYDELRLQGYGLGWMVGTYRRRPMLWHNGGIDGFLTNLVLLPDDGIGALASANSHMTQLSLVAVLDIVDALLGEEPAGWGERILSPSPSAATTEATPAPRPAEPAPYAHRPADYAGVFRHAGFGDLTVTAADDRLAVRVGEFDVEAKHRGYETWDLRYDVLDADLTATFVADADGVVDTVLVRTDDEPGSVPFSRVSEGEQS